MNSHRIIFHLRKITILLVFLAVNVICLFAQDSLYIKGTILNGSNVPVPNVSVGVEGSFALPSVTNEKGEYALKAPLQSKWLNVAPSSEYKKKRIYINNRSEINIFLTENELASGDDAVNILSRNVLARNVLSNYSNLDVRNIQFSSSLSIDQYMQGRITGMNVTNHSGDPGSGASVFIRGVNSLNATNQPLYLVDGVPLASMGIFSSNLEGYNHNPLLGVNSLDISNVTIVKDPAITAAYGSKASNGIVMIETLNPSATQTVIELDIRSGYSLTPANLIPQMDATQHKTLASEVLFTSGKHEELIEEEYPNLYLKPGSERFQDYQHNTNWQNIIFGNAAMKNVNINVKGGDEIARYGLSFGYLSADGIIKTTGYDGYNLRFVSLLNIFTWLKMNAGVSMNYSNASLKESAKVTETSPIYTALAKSPMLNPFQYDEDGNELTALAEVDELGVSNPQAVIDNYEAKNSNFNFVSKLGFDVVLNKKMNVYTNFSMTYSVLKEQIFMPNHGMEHYYNKEAINVSKASNNSLSSFYNNTYMIYRILSGNDHALTSNSGINLFNNKFEYDWGLTKNAHQNDQYRMLQDGTQSLREIGGANRIWNWVSFYENINYIYRDKYMALLTISVDGSSRIGKEAANTLKIGEQPFGVFYSGGLGWRISNEPFLNSKSWLEDLKLRITYGKSGNDDIGESNATNYYNAVRFRETVGLSPSVFVNRKLTYETVSQFNTGLDLALFGNRLTGTLDMFKSITNNMLVYTPLEAYFGFDVRPENNGKMQNVGMDVNIFYRIIDKPSFKWDLRGIWSTVANKIVDIKGGKLVTALKGLEIVNMPGEQANSFYGYVFEGVYKTTLEAENSKLVNDKLIKYKAGDARYADISGPAGSPDNVINDFDKVVIGSSLPENLFGVNNTFTYKKWSLNTFIQAVTGNEVYNYVRYLNERMTGLANQSTTVLNRWQNEGQETDIPRAQWNDPIGNSAFSTR